MKIVLLYLYPDLMNLYGSSGNMRCWVRHLMTAGAELEVRYRSVGEPIDFDGVHFVYIGAGTERSQKRALTDLLTVRDAFARYIENGGFALLCGNAGEMLGRRFVDLEGQTFEGLGIQNFETVQEQRRTVCDVVCTCPLTSRKIIGFLNLQSRMTPVENPLFQVIGGRGNAPDAPEEGFFDKNLFATHLSGPILIRNPHFRAMLENRLYTQLDLPFTPQDLPYEQQAYEESLRSLEAAL